MTYLLLDTSTPICRVTIVTKDGARHAYEWEAQRELAHFLLRYITDTLAKQQLSIPDLTGIGVMEGPGSYTGLRIGLTVVNTIAGDLAIPIVGATGENWCDDAIRRLNEGETDRIVMPQYGGEARITTPRK